MSARARRAVLLTVLVLTVSLMAGSAAATPFEDITDRFSESLGLSEYTALMLLSFMGIATLGLALGVLGLDIMTNLLILIIAAGLFIAVGWLDKWIGVLIAVVVAVYFASAVKSGAVDG